MQFGDGGEDGFRAALPVGEGKVPQDFGVDSVPGDIAFGDGQAGLVEGEIGGQGVECLLLVADLLRGGGTGDPGMVERAGYGAAEMQIAPSDVGFFAGQEGQEFGGVGGVQRGGEALGAASGVGSGSCAEGAGDFDAGVGQIDEGLPEVKGVGRGVEPDGDFPVHGSAAGYGSQGELRGARLVTEGALDIEGSGEGGIVGEMLFGGQGDGAREVEVFEAAGSFEAFEVAEFGGAGDLPAQGLDTGAFGDDLFGVGIEIGIHAQVFQGDALNRHAEIGAAQFAGGVVVAEGDVAGGSGGGDGAAGELREVPESDAGLVLAGPDRGREVVEFGVVEFDFRIRGLHFGAGDEDAVRFHGGGGGEFEIQSGEVQRGESDVAGVARAGRVESDLRPEIFAARVPGLDARRRAGGFEQDGAVLQVESGYFEIEDDFGGVFAGLPDSGVGEVRFSVGGDDQVGFGTEGFG